jgi:hypothetical protein
MRRLYDQQKPPLRASVSPRFNSYRMNFLRRLFARDFGRGLMSVREWYFFQPSLRDSRCFLGRESQR